jgi:hypothetical protein
MQWNGIMEWNAMEWNHGMECNGMQWNHGIKSCKIGILHEKI